MEIAAPAATFQFEPAGEDARDELTPAKQDEFRSDFNRDLRRLGTWAAENDWSPAVVPRLQVVVSHKYRISKSLVPAWYGRAGCMQFPAWRVAARTAAIAHELVHVFFPNGNRFLAEGLAVYLQAEIGGNPAFPNFGRPLHAQARELMHRMAPAAARGGAMNFDCINLSALDDVATPNPLVLAVGQDFYGEDARGQAHVYPIAGSFVQFLVETFGLERFRTLYAQTPLMPSELNRGEPDRWIGAYGCPLADLERQWKSSLGECRPAIDQPLSSTRNKEHGHA